MLPVSVILPAIQLLFLPGVRSKVGSVLYKYIFPAGGKGKVLTEPEAGDGDGGERPLDKYEFMGRIAAGNKIRQGRYRPGGAPGGVIIGGSFASGKPDAAPAGVAGEDRSQMQDGNMYSGSYPDKDSSEEDRMKDLLEDGATEDAVIIRRLVHYFEKDKPFLHSDLKIGEVALQIYTNKTYLSRALNRKTAKNFNQFVNYFRIKEACRMFLEQPHIRAQELCDKCGFNSISSFSTAFRINTGYSPAEWCKEVKCKLNNDEPVSLEKYFI